MKTTWRRPLVWGTLLALALVTGAVVLSTPPFQWRAELVKMKVTGSLTGMSWGELVQAMGRERPYHVQTLLRTGDAREAFRNPHDTPTDIERGGALFRSYCASCHGLDGSGGTAPPLARGLRRVETDWEIFEAIDLGISGTAMLPVNLPSDSIWPVVAYVRWISEGTDGVPLGTDPSAGVLPPGLAIRRPGVTPRRLLRAHEEPHNWLTYGGTYAAHRHSPLRGIDRRNVRDLKVRWVFQMPTELNSVETTPIVVDGIMYVTEPPATVVALDGATGEQRWRYVSRMPDRINNCCGLVNRGVAVLGDRVFIGTLDARLIALDAGTGAPVWDVEVADNTTGYSITVAPLAVKGKVIVGISGGEYGIRGFLDAYDAETGERVWRFYTVPGPGEPGHETWGGDSWKTGGAPTWMTGSYDPELNLVYWGVGNPGPPWDGSDRPGDNLYSNSVIALDVDTGELRWHFQFTPHDEYDWDANQVPILLDADYEGAPRRLMAWANRNAFFYLLDRETGEFLLAREYAKQTWAEGIDAAGRPIRIPGTSPSPEGTLVYPAALGATNWWPPAYNPATGLVYVPTFPESSDIYYSGPVEYVPGRTFHGSMNQPSSDEPLIPALAAIDPLTGETRWTYTLPGRIGGEHHGIGGALSTAGEIVFSGSGGTFVAFDASTGRELWRFNTGGTILAGPVSYAVDGTQYVSVAAGRAIFAFARE